MAEINLKKMSMSELKALRKKVDRAIESVEKRERKDALAKISAKARELGFSLDDLVGAQKAKSGATPAKPAKAKAKSKGVAKYRNPENPSQTWTGRGRQPNWIKDAIAEGKSMDDFAIR